MEPVAALPLRLLSLDIQGGPHTTRYRDYLSQSWQHVLPARSKRVNLERIAVLAGRYDIVALQEADAGSLRTARRNQVAHLAQRAGFGHWHAAVTRNLGPFAQHCLGCLSRWPLEAVHYHPLPGWLLGRSALDVRVRPPGCDRLRLIIVHLTLGRRARLPQLRLLAGLLRPAHGAGRGA